MYQQVLIALVPTVFALVFFSRIWVVAVFIMLGQGHFFTAYLYQYRAGKMNAAYWWKFFGTAALAALFLYVTDASLSALILVTAFIFETHFVVDELYLLRVKMEPLLVFAVAPFFFLYPLSILDKLFGVHLTDPAILVALLSVSVYVAASLWYRKISYGGLWMAFLAVVLILSVKIFHVSVEKLLASVVLYHYFRWLLFYVDKYWKTPRFVPYVRDVALVHATAAALFVWYWFFPGLGRTVLALLFAQMSFYLWTWLHIFTSLRLDNFKLSFWARDVS